MILKDSCCLIAQKDHCDSKVSLPFGMHINPYDILSDRMYHNGMHMEENQVLFFEYDKDEG